ncbi:hypothetical protein P691DRAFT_825695 [Macrolepiota fuliginosa MF-IS2]|uniref:Endonuclease/exonuclease/phosphatase domain-containing protein n=1 Tax=Macrolepiota fuliginosa MF-IS2 TaxID=1400762 RepID=A0A9P6BV02_9AGAR|nr:hypothetical protein P691DRAFT_825695 [Macrolepiota fuliginosa MF-IS2]
MAYYQPCPGLQIALQSDLTQDRDLQILNVSIPGKPTTLIMNLYNDCGRHLKWASACLQSTPLPTNQPIVITGDWNMHHHLWSTNNHINHNPEMENTVEWLTTQGFLLNNTPGEHMHIPHASRGSPLTIDLTFTNRPTTQQAIPFDWVIQPEFTYDSDHQAILWTLFNNIEPIDNSCGIHYNMKDTDQDKWQEALKENIKTFQKPLNTLMDMDRDISTDELEEAASALTSIISQTNSKAAK